MKRLNLFFTIFCLTLLILSHVDIQASKQSATIQEKQLAALPKVKRPVNPVSKTLMAASVVVQNQESSVQNNKSVIQTTNLPQRVTFAKSVSIKYLPARQLQPARGPVDQSMQQIDQSNVVRNPQLKHEPLWVKQAQEQRAQRAQTRIKEHATLNGRLSILKKEGMVSCAKDFTCLCCVPNICCAPCCVGYICCNNKASFSCLVSNYGGTRDYDGEAIDEPECLCGICCVYCEKDGDL